jgi:hypothetical protein
VITLAELIRSIEEQEAAAARTMSRILDLIAAGEHRMLVERELAAMRTGHAERTQHLRRALYPPEALEAVEQLMAAGASARSASYAVARHLAAQAGGERREIEEAADRAAEALRKRVTRKKPPRP